MCESEEGGGDLRVVGSSLKRENTLAPSFVTFGYVEAIWNGEDASMVSFARKGARKVLGMGIAELWLGKFCVWADRVTQPCFLQPPAVTQRQPDAYLTVLLWPSHFTICLAPIITSFLCVKYGFFQCRQILFYFFSMKTKQLWNISCQTSFVPPKVQKKTGPFHSLCRLIWVSCSKKLANSSRSHQKTLGASRQII